MPSKQDIRVEKLRNVVAQKGQLHLRDAAILLGVSEMTVRRDIAAHGTAFVNLGGHIFLSPTRSGYKIGSEDLSVTNVKAVAAAEAAKLLKPQSTIFIDSGTTLLHLVDAIPADFELTIVTSSLNVAARIADKENIRLVLLGGLYHPASDCFISNAGQVGPQNLGINQAFLSAGGYDAVRGASCYQFHESQIKVAIMDQSNHKYLVVDSSKIGVLKPVIFAQPSAFEAVITENGTI